MSPSSSGSWSGGGGADIIDLDRYMRGNVRPSRTLTNESKRERLVVDAGGAAACKPASSASGGETNTRHKRYWHDSGVDDGSYRPRRTHRPHKRSVQEDPSLRASHEQTSLKKRQVRSPSSSSLRAFRTMCQEALRDQQQQIARVAELCERLAEHAEKTALETAKRERGAEFGRAPSVETSEISSSSRSSKDRRKDRDRTQECKTYKIIMNKLDELNRVFVPRPRAPPRAPARAPPRAPPRPASSSTSVTVSDKLTATEPQRTVNRVLSPSRTTRTIQRQRSDTTRGRTSLASTRVFTVDIAPRDTQRPLPPNVRTDSIVKSSVVGSQQSASGPRGGLESEGHVKRLQALTCSSRRSRSAEESRVRAPSLCAVCRAYWSWLRRYIEPARTRTTDDACDYS